LLLAVERKHPVEEVGHRLTAQRNFFQIQTHQRATAARQRQRVVAADYAILTFCENFIIYRGVGDMRLAACCIRRCFY
jgi:hypothetical protein